jgi:hypothetical protein
MVIANRQAHKYPALTGNVPPALILIPPNGGSEPSG